MTLGNTPPQGTGKVQRNPANEETTVLTPVTEHTDALNRIPVRQRTLWIVLTAVLAALLIASVVVTVNAVQTSDEWEARAGEFEATSYDLGADLATEQDLVVEQQARIDLLSEQLQTSNDKLIALADEYANVDDTTAFQEQQIQQLTELLLTGTSVANALSRCVDGQRQLAEYLHTPEDYDEEELADFEQSVNDLCDAADDAHQSFQEAITQ